MLQSKQSWLPRLDSPTALQDVLSTTDAKQILIAHCMEDSGQPRIPILRALKPSTDSLILIGPEGDFTPSEVTLAIASGAVPVSIGNNRLRTETAALTAITTFYLTNNAV